MSAQTGGGSTRLGIEEVVGEVVIPPGVIGPDPLTMDVRSYAVAQPAGIVIIDTGMPGSEAGIAAAVEALGGSFDDVRDIILTHLHQDHIGSLFAIADRAPLAAIYAGGPDSPDIQSPRRIRPTGEGEAIQDLGVLATPGHTPGHLSLFHEPTGTLFIGDAASSAQGEAIRGPEVFTADADQAEDSLERIAALGPARILFAHGAEIDSPAQALGRLIGGPPPQAWHLAPVDGEIPAFAAGARGSSVVVQEMFPGAAVVKTFKHTGYHSLEPDRRPAGAGAPAPAA